MLFYSWRVGYLLSRSGMTILTLPGFESRQRVHTCTAEVMAERHIHSNRAQNMTNVALLPLSLQFLSSETMATPSMIMS